MTSDGEDKPVETTVEETNAEDHVENKAEEVKKEDGPKEEEKKDDEKKTEDGAKPGEEAGGRRRKRKSLWDTDAPDAKTGKPNIWHETTHKQPSSLRDLGFNVDFKDIGLWCLSGGFRKNFRDTSVVCKLSVRNMMPFSCVLYALLSCGSYIPGVGTPSSRCRNPWSD